MTAHGSHIQPKIIPVLAGPEQTQVAVTTLRAVLRELHDVVQQETDLVYRSKMREARPLEPTKKELTRKFFASIDILKANIGEFKRHTPDALSQLMKEHASFQSLLERNMAVLATAHAVAEGLVKQAARFAAEQRSPQTYGANGRATAPNMHKAGPMMVAKVL
jgi:O-phosphoseryl-tRNA(Cys) synthetase